MDDTQDNSDARIPRLNLDDPSPVDSVAQLQQTENMVVLHTFVEAGSVAETSRRTGLTTYAIIAMSSQPWWQRELAAIQREKTALETMKISQMYGKTLQLLDETLEKGEIVLKQGVPVMEENLETGELEHMRAPLDPRTLAKISQVLFDQRQILRDLPTTIVGSNSKLEELAEKLKRLGNARTIEHDE